MPQTLDRLKMTRRWGPRGSAVGWWRHGARSTCASRVKRRVERVWEAWDASELYRYFQTTVEPQKTCIIHYISIIKFNSSEAPRSSPSTTDRTGYPQITSDGWTIIQICIQIHSRIFQNGGKNRTWPGFFGRVLASSAYRKFRTTP